MAAWPRSNHRAEPDIDPARLHDGFIAPQLFARSNAAESSGLQGNWSTANGSSSSPQPGYNPDTSIPTRIAISSATTSPSARQHVQFRFFNAEFRVVDVGSLNGIFVNREP